MLIWSTKLQSGYFFINGVEFQCHLCLSGGNQGRKTREYHHHEQLSLHCWCFWRECKEDTKYQSDINFKKQYLAIWTLEVSVAQTTGQKSVTKRPTQWRNGHSRCLNFPWINIHQQNKLVTCKLWIRARYESEVRDSRAEHEAKEEEKIALLCPSPVVIISQRDKGSP